MGEGKLAGLQHTWEPQERPSSVEHIWQEVLQVVRERVEATKYATWFAPLRPLSGAVGMLRIAVPNKFVRDWLVEHYHEFISETLQELTGVPYQVVLVAICKTKGLRTDAIDGNQVALREFDHLL